MREKFLESIESAEKSIQIADHMTYVTYPVVKDSRLLLKVIELISEGVFHTINAILQYDYVYKRIRLSSDAKENFRLFMERCVSDYKLEDIEKEKIKELFRIAELHKHSAFEFVRGEKIVIMFEGARTEVLNLERIKGFLNLAKVIYKKVSGLINRNMV